MVNNVGKLWLVVVELSSHIKVLCALPREHKNNMVVEFQIDFAVRLVGLYCLNERLTRACNVSVSVFILLAIIDERERQII
ncbi:hypothetical protein B6A42_26850 (plasmid) [Vibrio coralliilyticus]|nr:hypothetical protein B6A42_26850 [Vibrio coralliilyticus]